MENADKVQDVSPEKIETPEEVQQEAESSVNSSDDPPIEAEHIQVEEPEIAQESPAPESEDAASYPEVVSVDEPEEPSNEIAATQPEEVAVQEEAPEQPLEPEAATEPEVNEASMTESDEETNESANSVAESAEEPNQSEDEAVETEVVSVVKTEEPSDEIAATQSEEVAVQGEAPEQALEPEATPEPEVSEVSVTESSEETNESANSAAESAEEPDQSEGEAVETEEVPADDLEEPSEEVAATQSEGVAMQEEVPEQFLEPEVSEASTTENSEETKEPANSGTESVEESDQPEEKTVEKIETTESVVKEEGSEEVAEHSDEKEPAEHEEEQHENLDFSSASKEELLAKIKELGKEERIPRIDRVIKALKPRFEELYQAERLTALNKFELEGNDPDSFEYHGGEVDKEFNSLFSALRSKRNRFYKDLENQKDENLKKKESLLERVRQLVDGEESNESFNSVKEIQAEWKKVGPVPGAHNKTLWANYNALLDRFYDQRSIYFELKDLDRKKNLKVKEDICARAEALGNQEDLKSAIVQLNDLHEEYKHAGSVPREDQEALWQRFKIASDGVYSKRKDYFDNLKGEFEKNLEKKVELAKLAESYVPFDSDGITEWNSKTKEIQDIQRKWEAIGGLPRDKAKVINKQFWGSFKKFFNNKNQFFKKLEGARDENLQKKEELISQAEELKESSDWGGTTQKYKDLQAKWKDIGPVPEKVRNEIYKRFKAAGDHFFDRRREQNSEQDKQYEDNFKLKLQICDQITAIAGKDEINLDDVYDLIDNHAQLGFVPRNAIKKDRARFEEATEKILSLEELEPGDKDALKKHIQLRTMRSSPGGDKKVQRKEHSAKRKISELESNINTWNTNMEFFAASATADKLKADLQMKINEARGELESLKSQLGSIN